MSRQYQLVDGNYLYYHPLLGQVDAGEEVGLHIDLHTGSVLKHGRPDLVEAHYRVLHAAFVTAGRPQEAADLVFIQGKFELDELNKMLGIAGYAGRFYRTNIATNQQEGLHHVAH